MLNNTAQKAAEEFEKHNVACIILASGRGRRFGGNKLLADFRGLPLFRHILRAAKPVFANRLLVVTRCREVAAFCAKSNIPCLAHELPLQSDTIRLGVQRCQKFNPQGYLFCVADQPLLKTVTLRAMLRSFQQEPHYIYRAAHGEKKGSPVLFPAAFAAELTQLPADCGGSWLLKKYPELVRCVQVQDKNELYDIDTADDLNWLLQK